MNTKLRCLRIERGYTIQAAAKQIGYTYPSYARIERGEYIGTISFWRSIQQLFQVPDAEMWELINCNKEMEKGERNG